MLVPLKLPPGLFQNGTLYQAKDRWARGSLVRFYEKTIRPVGGWQEFTASAAVEEVLFADAFTSAGPRATLPGHTPTGGGFSWVAGTYETCLGFYVYNAIPPTYVTPISPANTAQTEMWDSTDPAPKWGPEHSLTADIFTGILDPQVTAIAVANTAMTDVRQVVKATVTVRSSRTRQMLVGVFAGANANGSGGYLVTAGSTGSNDQSIILWSRDSAGVMTQITRIHDSFGGLFTFDAPFTVALVSDGTTGHADYEFPITLTTPGYPGLFGAVGDDGGTAADTLVIDDFSASLGVRTEITLDGVPRAVLGWRGSDGNQTVAIGTNTKMYAHLEGLLYDITPSGFTPGSVDGEYATGNYGDGVYGGGPYGVSDPAQTTFSPPAVWHLDTFGEYLVSCCAPNDGKLYVWDRSPNDIAVAMSGAPTQCLGVVVTPERFVVALGAGNVSRHIQWASQETTDTWTPDVSNTAGSLDLEGVGILVAGRRGKGETILWTTDDVHALRYIGGTLVYALERVGGKCGLLSPGAVAMVDDKAIWMSKGQFFLYDGYVQAIPCDVSDEVFSDFNPNQSGKVTALPISRFGEIWWFYPSANSSENDKYVVWNYRENHWTTGDLPRTAGCDSGAIDYPLLASPNGKLWEHERTFSHTDLAGNTLSPYLESGPVEAGQGDQVLYISQILPDERTLGQVELSLYGSFEPMAAETLYGPFTIDKNTDARMTARWVRLRLDQVVEEDWRVGVIRLDGVPAGARGSPR